MLSPEQQEQYNQQNTYQQGYQPNTYQPQPVQSQAETLRKLTGQYDLDIKQSKTEFLYVIKRKITSFSIWMEALPYWRSVNTIIAILLSITFVGAVVIILANSYRDLPQNLPLVYKQSSNSWELVDKELIVSVPIIIGVILLVLIKLSSSIFKFDRRLSVMINLAIILLNSLGIIAFVQIISLFLIY